MFRIEKITRARIIRIACLFCCIACGCTHQKYKNVDRSPEWLPLSIEAKERVVNDYADALDEFAKVIPIIDDDSEAQWAADTVHCMISAMKEEKYSFLKDMAILCHIQDYISYGMVYFNAIIGTHKNPELAGYALNIITQSDSLYNDLSKIDFNDVRKLALMQSLSAYNMQLFTTLNRINNDKDINRELYFSLYSYAVVDSVSQQEGYSDSEIFKVSCAMEAYSYFQMMCPLLSLFAGSQERYDANIKDITDAAKHYDGQASQIFQAVSEGNNISVLNDAEFEKWLVTAWEYKVKLMRTLTKLVKDWAFTKVNR